MILIKGKFNSAKVFTDNLEDTARAQIQTICDFEILQDTKIRIMPDVHAGKGCTIGTTMTIKDYVIPNLVGVDIGCGIIVARLAEQSLDLPMLDNIIKRQIPAGKNTHNSVVAKFPKLKRLNCLGHLKNLNRIEQSIGTLGGGNHFIEVNRDESGCLYIAIHSGSRNLGKQVAEHYQKLAYTLLSKNLSPSDLPPKDLAYLSGKHFNMYIDDMKICQEYAMQNRKTMLAIIVDTMRLHVNDQFTTVHNYIDTNDMILRKGAVSAKKGEKLIIPINMRDGSLICVGKGNRDWNQSAPHGAGRLMSRRQALSTLSMSDFQQSMSGIYTTSLSKRTLDEAPHAYKPISEITKHLDATAEITHKLAPIYNFKSEE